MAGVPIFRTNPLIAASGFAGATEEEELQALIPAPLEAPPAVASTKEKVMGDVRGLAGIAKTLSGVSAAQNVGAVLGARAGGQPPPVREFPKQATGRDRDLQAVMGAPSQVPTDEATKAKKATQETKMTLADGSKLTMTRPMPKGIEDLDAAARYIVGGMRPEQTAEPAPRPLPVTPAPAAVPGMYPATSTPEQAVARSAEARGAFEAGYGVEEPRKPSVWTSPAFYAALGGIGEAFSEPGSVGQRLGTLGRTRNEAIMYARAAEKVQKGEPLTETDMAGMPPGMADVLMQRSESAAKQRLEEVESVLGYRLKAAEAGRAEQMHEPKLAKAQWDAAIRAFEAEPESLEAQRALTGARTSYYEAAREKAMATAEREGLHPMTKDAFAMSYKDVAARSIFLETPAQTEAALANSLGQKLRAGLVAEKDRGVVERVIKEHLASSTGMSERGLDELVAAPMEQFEASIAESKFTATEALAIMALRR